MTYLLYLGGANVCGRQWTETTVVHGDATRTALILVLLMLFICGRRDLQASCGARHMALRLKVC